MNSATRGPPRGRSGKHETRTRSSLSSGRANGSLLRFGSAVANCRHMGRLFLSGQTTCALLLGAGLLLRAQGAFRSPEHAAMDSAKTRPAEMAGERAAR